jgi:hypothetical protein
MTGVYVDAARGVLHRVLGDARCAVTVRDRLAVSDAD